MAQSMGVLSLRRAINGCPSSDVLAQVRGCCYSSAAVSAVRCPFSVVRSQSDAADTALFQHRFRLE